MIKSFYEEPIWLQLYFFLMVVIELRIMYRNFLPLLYREFRR